MPCGWSDAIVVLAAFKTRAHAPVASRSPLLVVVQRLAEGERHPSRSGSPRAVSRRRSYARQRRAVSNRPAYRPLLETSPGLWPHGVGLAASPSPWFTPCDAGGIAGHLQPSRHESPWLASMVFPSGRSSAHRPRSASRPCRGVHERRITVARRSGNVPSTRLRDARGTYGVHPK